MTANELRQKYLEFFKSKGHAIIPSASLIPENDPTSLFTTAGMQPLVPYLMGEKHPMGLRLCDAQKCIRTGDIDDVGDNRHLTFFEMLGNWSLGDYFKKEAIAWSWEFLTSREWLGLDPTRLFVTVFRGDEKSDQDEISINAWKEQYIKVGIKAEACDCGQAITGDPNLRIFTLPAKDNWWEQGGETGPCGPDTEMFYDVRPELGSLRGTFDEEVEKGRIMEIWNNVFMEFNKMPGGRYERLSQQNVDTGMGIERTISVLNGKQDAFDNELFYPLIQKVEELSGKKYDESSEIKRAMRIIADHIKAATFILGDDKGLAPSNVGAGYVLRRLIRRAVRYGKQLGINDIFTFKIAEEVVKIYQDAYAELKKNKEFIINQLVKEEEKFSQTIERGLKVLWGEIKSEEGGAGYKGLRLITGKWLFDIYQTHGFPLEMSFEELQKREIIFSESDKGQIENEFNSELKRHQEQSRTASAGMFKGGLADASEATVKYHTAAHLMLAALRQVLGEHVQQKGSNITAERLRFDFSHGEKMTPEQIKKVEEIVNAQIQADLPIVCEEMTLDEAKAKGAMGVFESKYGEKVKVYTIGDPSTRSARSGPPFSREICGGPHVARTGELAGSRDPDGFSRKGKFKIVKEEASSSGVRRIKAVLE